MLPAAVPGPAPPAPAGGSSWTGPLGGPSPGTPLPQQLSKLSIGEPAPSPSPGAYAAHPSPYCQPLQPQHRQVATAAAYPTPCPGYPAPLHPAPSAAGSWPAQPLTPQPLTSTAPQSAFSWPQPPVPGPLLQPAQSWPKPPVPGPLPQSAQSWPKPPIPAPMPQPAHSWPAVAGPTPVPLGSQPLGYAPAPPPATSLYPPLCGSPGGAEGLWEAATAGNVPRLRQLLLAGLAPDTPGPEGRTALMQAAESGEEAAVRALLLAGASPVVADRSGATAVHAAAQRGHVACLRAMLAAAGGAVNAGAGGDLGTPLHQAAYFGQVETVEALLAGGADVNSAAASDGSTPLHFAARMGRAQTVRVLLQAGASACTQDAAAGDTPLHAMVRSWAPEKGVQFEAAASALLAAAGDSGGPSPSGVLNRAGESALALAEGRRLERLLRLLREHLQQGLGPVPRCPPTPTAGPSSAPAADPRRALCRAAELGDLEAVQGLLARRVASPNATNSDGLTALHLAARDGHALVAQALVGAGADLEAACSLEVELMGQQKMAEGLTPLHLAAMEGQVAVIEALCQAGAPLDSGHQGPGTPLHFAAGFSTPAAVQAALGDNLETVQALIAAKADVNAKGNNGQSVLHMAAVGGSAETIGTLLAAKAQIHAKMENKVKPIHVACLYGNAAGVEALLEGGASGFSKAADGSQPIHCAVMSGCTETVRRLEDGVFGSCAHFRVEDTGRKPMHLAAEHGDLKMVQLLLERGASPKTEDKEGITPYQLAAEEGHEEVARLLLDAAGLNPAALMEEGKKHMRNKDYKWARQCFAAAWRVQNDYPEAEDLWAEANAAVKARGEKRKEKTKQTLELVGGVLEVLGALNELSK